MGFGQSVVGAKGVRLHVECGELGSIGKVDRQGRAAAGRATVLFEQVLDRGESGCAALKGFAQGRAEGGGTVEGQQVCESGGQQGGGATAGEGSAEKGFDFGDGEPEGRVHRGGQRGAFAGQQRGDVG